MPPVRRWSCSLSPSHKSHKSHHLRGAGNSRNWTKKMQKSKHDNYWYYCMLKKVKDLSYLRHLWRFFNDFHWFMHITREYWELHNWLSKFGCHHMKPVRSACVSLTSQTSKGSVDLIQGSQTDPNASKPTAFSRYAFSAWQAKQNDATFCTKCMTIWMDLDDFLLIQTFHLRRATS